MPGEPGRLLSVQAPVALQYGSLEPRRWAPPRMRRSSARYQLARERAQRHRRCVPYSREPIGVLGESQFTDWLLRPHAAAVLFFMATSMVGQKAGALPGLGLPRQ